MGLNFRCIRGYNGFCENYSTKISNAHERKRAGRPSPVLILYCHRRCGSLERTSGRASETTKFIQRKLCRQLSAKFKFYEIEALYGIVYMYMYVYVAYGGMYMFRMAGTLWYDPNPSLSLYGTVG